MPTRAAQIAALSLPLDQLPDPLPIPTIEKPFDVTIRPPGSKSITNRALLLAALADGTSELRGPLIDADDAQVMLRAIQQLGAKVEITRGGTGGSSASGVANLDIVRITGVNGRWRIPHGQTITLNLNNAGTATRFLTAAAILAPADSGGIMIDGDARMRQRPIGELVEALRSIGVTIEYLGNPGCPPVHVHAPRSTRSIPALASFGPTTSSQFISAMLLVAPFLPKGLDLRMPAQPTSAPYVGMSVMIMTLLGLERHSGDYCVINCQEAEESSTEVRIKPQHWLAFRFEVEPDASGASYFEGAASLIYDARVVIDGLVPYPPTERSSLQGDTHFVDVLRRMGNQVDSLPRGLQVTGPSVLRPVKVDLSNMPDTAMTAAALACFASPTPDNPTATSTLRGLRTLRVKETDRLAALQTELTKLGATVEIIPESLNGQPDESLRITPPPLPTAHSPLPPLSFATYHDHRMAMSLALIGLRRPNVLIQNPACVAKTYPTFWKDLAKLYS